MHYFFKPFEYTFLSDWEQFIGFFSSKNLLGVNSDNICSRFWWNKKLLQILLSTFKIFSLHNFGVPTPWLITKQKVDFRSKDMSDSRSGATNKYLDYNEGLKIGFFSYLISTYKCYGPNKTNFMDFGQKLAIS